MNGDKEAITKLLDAYVEHWNNKDLDQCGKLFTSDVDYANRGGGWWQSNAENVEGHKKLFGMNMERVTTFRNYEASVANITFLNEDIALVHAGGGGHVNPNRLTVIFSRRYDFGCN
jgi:uncharacterized protein (TIGR02246 family)